MLRKLTRRIDDFTFYHGFDKSLRAETKSRFFRMNLMFS